jgi:hypothetical protein
VFCGSAPRLYNADLKQLELELGRVPELVVGRLRRNYKKGFGLYKEDFIVCYSDSETVTNPLPGND